MRKLNLLLAIFCLLFTYACQKEIAAPIPESTPLIIETTDESQYFKINTLEDLATFEELFVKNESAVSRSSICGKIVHVASGSKNAIQAAIAEAGHYGLVVLAKGNHYEEAPIIINHPVYILGRKGATIMAGSQVSEVVGLLEPIFSIRQTTRVTIWGVAMQGREDGSNTAIEILNSTHTVVSKNTIDNFQIGIIVHEGDNTLLWKNNISGGLGGLPITVGMGIINGVNVRILQNKISRFIIGIVCGSQNGIIQDNELFGNLGGLSLNLIRPFVQTSVGNIVGSKGPATNWTVQNNYAHHNDSGYGASDGANNNKFINNRGENNATIDLILFPKTINILGMSVTTSFDNFVDARDNTDFTIQDCGNNNRVVGGIQIPCE